MAKCVNALDGFTLNDLMSQDGLTIEIGNEYVDEEEEEFSRTPDVHLTNEEALNLLNMEDFVDEEEDNGDNEEETEASAFMPCGMSFGKLKARMTDVTGDGKLLKLVKREGVGETVPENALVTVSYIGYFEYADEPFDSTYLRGGTEKLRLGGVSLIPGLEIGLQTMRKHEIAIFIVHPDLAYGQLGCPPRIPPNEEVMFAVRLLDFLDDGSADTYENLSIEERRQFPNIVKCVNDMLTTAKESFKRRKVKQAIREYKRAISRLENAELRNDEEEEQANRLLSKAYCNLAVCFNLEDMPRHACMACNKIPHKTAKSHFNHGRALLKMGEYARAMQELQVSYRMEPGNKETFKEIQLVNEKQKKYLEVEKRLWANCLKASKEEKEVSNFDKAARDMCEAFACDDKLLRLPLPEGLTPEEEKCVSEHAAALGLSVTTHLRYNKRLTYLQKPKY